MSEARTGPVWIVVALILILQAGAGFAIYALLPTWEIRSAFGDMFGGITALFSGLALAGVVYAILLQQKELSLQRQELELTRKELERSAEAQEKSAGLLAEQLRQTKEHMALTERSLASEAAPAFRWARGSHPPGGRAVAYLVNDGGTVRDLAASVDGAQRVRFEPAALVQNGGNTEFEVLYDPSCPPPWIATVQYVDRYDVRRTKRFEFDPGRGLFREHVST